MAGALDALIEKRKKERKRKIPLLQQRSIDHSPQGPCSTSADKKTQFVKAAQ